MAIEGLIGSGKTTTAKLVARSTQASLVLEQAELHPTLEAFYGDPVLHALETEVIFSALRAHQLKTTPRDGPIVSDFAPGKTAVFSNLNLSESDARHVQELDRRLLGSGLSPDVTVFLDLPIERCLARIHDRNRPFEDSIDHDFLHLLRNQYLADLEILGTDVITVELSGTESRDTVSALLLSALGRPS